MTERLAADPAGIDRAASLLRAGGLVAFGTETVYGLGADATDAQAVGAIFAAKGRPAFNPLIAHFPDALAAFAHVQASPLAHRLADRFWPGPLTLVLPRRPGSPVCAAVTAGLPTLAVRVPGGRIAQALLRAAGRPVAAPSANPSSGVSPTTAEHVLAGLDGRIDAVLDSGPCVVGLESTVLDLSGATPRLLRPGGVPLEALQPYATILHGPAEPAASPASPGLLASHYAPSLPLRLDAAAAADDEALLAFGPVETRAGLVWNLSPSGDLDEAASRLFAGLRRLDDLGRARGLTGIAAMAIPPVGIGIAIRDRLQRAAAPRPGLSSPAAPESAS